MSDLLPGHSKDTPAVKSLLAKFEAQQKEIERLQRENEALDKHREKLIDVIDDHMTNIEHLETMLSRLAEALDFYDKVCAASVDERIAVGTDHIEWVLKEARNAASHRSKDDD